MSIDTRILFKKILNECQQEEEFCKSFNTKGEYSFIESVFMALIFEQQKMISELIDKLSKNRLRE